jgi:hypothetical protein
MNWKLLYILYIRLYNLSGEYYILSIIMQYNPVHFIVGITYLFNWKNESLYVPMNPNILLYFNIYFSIDY